MSVCGYIVIAVVILALGGGGVYAYYLYTQNKRKAAQRAAQRRAQAAQQQRASAQQRPGQPNQPRTGTYTNQAGTARPTGYPQPQARKPYAPGQSAYQRPAGQQPQQGTSAYQRPAGQTPVNPTGDFGSDDTLRTGNPFDRPAGTGATGSQGNPFDRPAGTGAGVTGSQSAFGSDETFRPSQSSPYSRPAGSAEPGSFTASYRDPQAPSTTQRMGRRQYRSQQNAGAHGADQPTSASSDDFKSDANTDDFS